MRKYYVYFEGQDELLAREGVNELPKPLFV